jgi:hypothetical protein
MKRYTFIAQVQSVSGHQVYHVDAETEDEARAVVERGGGEFDYEELEVQDRGRFELLEVDDVPADTGDQPC